MIRRVLGAMTGTSCDGLDLALLEVEGHGLELQTRFVQGFQYDLGDLGPRLRRLAEGEACTMEELCRLNEDFSSFHSDCIIKSNIGNIDLFVPHGQTLFHAPPLSLQMINLQKIAADLMVPVMGDLRGLDLAKGGQGAPITPLADYFFYRKKGEKRVIINLGGFCNLTFLPDDGLTENILGFDVCTTNLLLNLLSRMILNQPYDDGGKNAHEGKEIPDLRKDLETRLINQKKQGCSLGQQYFPDESWFRGHPLSVDLLKTSCLAIGSVIGSTVNSLGADRLLIAGGGSHNKVLMEAINNEAGLAPEQCSQYGPPSEFREAASMALLGTLCLDKVPITLEATTGAKEKFISGLFIDPRTP